MKKQTKKLLLLSFYYPPDLSAGSFRTAALVQALEPLLEPGDQIDVVCAMPNRYAAHVTPAAAEERHGAVRIRRVDLPAHESGMRDQALAYRHYVQAVLRIAGREAFDLVYATSSRLFTAFLGALAARRLGAPLYLDLRDIFTDTMASVLKSRLKHLLLPGLRGIERFTVGQATRVNLVSGGFEPYFRRLAPHKAFRLFTNGVDDAFVQRDFSKPAPGEPPVILYAGNMGEGQGLEHVVPRAARLLAGKARFRLIGGGGRLAELRRRLAAEGAEAELLDAMPRAELLDHYAQADYLFLHLNDYAAFEKVLPSKIFEYAATGKPIIAGVGGFARQFLEREVERCLLVPPRDAEALAAALAGFPPHEAPREAFVARFGRRQIMAELARDALELAG